MGRGVAGWVSPGRANPRNGVALRADPSPPAPLPQTARERGDETHASSDDDFLRERRVVPSATPDPARDRRISPRPARNRPWRAAASGTDHDRHRLHPTSAPRDHSRTLVLSYSRTLV